MPGPTIRRKLFAQRLEELRKASDLTSLDAGRAIGDKTDARYRNYEAGRRLPKYEAVELLGRRFGLDDAGLRELHAMREDADKPSQFAAHRVESAAVFMGLEEDATWVRTVQHVIVPGILQTEAYMRRLFTFGGLLTTTSVDNRVAARLQRQERLDGDDPLRLTAVISEAALRWTAAEPGIGRAQLDYLAQRAGQPNIDIHVVRFGAGLHPCMDGAFSLLRFPPGLLADVAYVEDAGGGHLIDTPTRVAELDKLFGELHGKAPGANESLAVIVQLAEQIAINQVGSTP